MRVSLKILWVIFLAIMIVGCNASQHSESAGEYLDSSTTTAKVKASLVDQLGTSGLFVNVKTYKDVVQLSGFVDTLKIKQRAGTIAARVDGVRLVRNNILVKT